MPKRIAVLHRQAGWSAHRGQHADPGHQSLLHQLEAGAPVQNRAPEELVDGVVPPHILTHQLQLALRIEQCGSVQTARAVENRLRGAQSFRKFQDRRSGDSGPGQCSRPRPARSRMLSRTLRSWTLHRSGASGRSIDGGFARRRDRNRIIPGRYRRNRVPSLACVGRAVPARKQCYASRSRV